jgi:hypothetical protein
MVRHLLTITTTTKILAGSPGSQTPAPFYRSVDIENPGLEAASSELESPQGPRGLSGRIRFRPVWMDALRLSLGRGGNWPGSAARILGSEPIEATGAKLRRGPGHLAERRDHGCGAATPPLFAVSIAVSTAVSIAAYGCRFAGPKPLLIFYCPD